MGGRGGRSDQENVISGDPCKSEHPCHLVHGAVRGLVTLCNSLISCCGLGGRATMAGVTQIASQVCVAKVTNATKICMHLLGAVGS